MERPGSAACHAADIVGRGIRSERLCYAAAKRLTGANGDRGGHPDEAALHPGGENANASKPLKITVEAAIRRPQLRRLVLTFCSVACIHGRMNREKAVTTILG